MAAKTPIRTVYNSDSVATGLAEFQAADFISLANGGTGASLSIGTAGQVLRVNAGASALEFASKEDLADITSIGSTLTAPSNADFTITTAGTGNIVLNDISISDNKIHATRSNDNLEITASGTGNVVIGAVTINGTTLSAADSSKITIAEALDVTGAFTSANVAITGGSVTGITDITVADGGTGASSLTDNAVLTGTGTSAITAEGNLSFDGSTLAVTGNLTLTTDLTVAHGGTGVSTLTDGGVLLGSGGGAITAMSVLSDGEMIVGDGSTDPVAESGATLRTSIGVGTGDSPQFTAVTATTSVTAVSLVTTGNAITIADNKITTAASNADINITPHGTGKVVLDGISYPASDGSNGQALVTDGSGTLSFGTVSGSAASDDTTVIKKLDKHITSTARVVDAFHSTFLDSALYYVVSSDHVNEQISVNKVSVCHNNSTSLYSVVGSSNDGTATTSFSTDLTADMVRLKATATGANGRLSYLKYGFGDNSSAATAGNTEIVINADVDSAAEAIDTFAHASYRGAKYFISVNNDTKTEVGNIEALVVHDGTTAYITTYGELESGDNSLITLTAAISGSNVVVSAAGGEANLRVTAHAIRLKDTMVSDDGTYDHTEAIAPVTISSTATEVDTLVEETANGAVYYFVSKNASEGEYAVNEVFVAVGTGGIGVASGPWVSTKDTNQLTFSTAWKDDVENTASILASSTSGGSTTVSAYRINLLAK